MPSCSMMDQRGKQYCNNLNQNNKGNCFVGNNYLPRHRSRIRGTVQPPLQRKIHPMQLHNKVAKLGKLRRSKPMLNSMANCEQTHMILFPVHRIVRIPDLQARRSLRPKRYHNKVATLRIHTRNILGRCSMDHAQPNRDPLSQTRRTDLQHLGDSLLRACQFQLSLPALSH